MRRMFFLLLVPAVLAAAPLHPDTPAELYGELFKRVQMQRIFPDDKDFVDSVPKRPPAEIMADYERCKDSATFDLTTFVRENFTPPRGAANIREHIESLWTRLQRDASHAPKMGSLIDLPHPYVVPGGRFEELYYWDSYFVMLGLMESGRVAMVQNMVDDFAFLIEHEGFVPNANRTYYLSRSQPPFFSLMVDLLAKARGDKVYRKYLPALQREYDFWMSGTGGHVVRVGKSILNRYYDREFEPREEQYRTDVKLSSAAKREPGKLFHEIRSAAESGWDFSSRWFADGETRATIRTTELVPVDLNCLIHHLELTLAKAYRLQGDKEASLKMSGLAEQRRSAINSIFWSDKAGWYVDFDLAADRRTHNLTLAGMAPFFLNVAPKERGGIVARTLANDFLKPGGVVTTLKRTGEQWDAPNGWAPLEWITIQGLRNYQQDHLAEEIARRWMKQNLKIFDATGKLMEKYDVMDLSRPGGGGEYPTQDGFGWTNGVLLKLLNLYGTP